MPKTQKASRTSNEGESPKRSPARAGGGNKVTKYTVDRTVGSSAKLKRTVSPSKGINMQRNDAHFIFVESVGNQGICICYAQKNFSEEQPFIAPALQQLMEDPDLALSLKIEHILQRKVEGSTEDEIMKAATTGKASNHDYMVLVHITPEADTATPDYLRKWGLGIANYLTDVGQSDKYKFPLFFRFSADVTNRPNNRPVCTYLLNRDVLMLCRRIYDPNEVPRRAIASDESLVRSFFGDWEGGRDEILTDTVRD